MRTVPLIACLSLVAVGAAPAAAPAAGVGTPDARVRLEADGGASEDRATVGARGNVGAQGFDNRITVGPDGAVITNPPMAAAYRFDRTGMHTEREELYGPPIATATLGTGGLTPTFDELGRLTGLNWPSPGYYDHVDFLQVTRGWPNRGAPVNAGSFGGVDGRWLTPQFGWSMEAQHYVEDTGTLVTVMREEETGLEVEITDVVDPERDVLARNFRFSQPVERFAYYANMNPTTSRVPRVPSVPDGFFDDEKDLATVFDARSSSLLHLRPYQVDPASASRLATSQPDRTTAEDAVAGTFGPGVYVAVAGQQEAVEHQAGLETVGLVRGEAEGTPLLDPYYDLVEDGSLSGSVAAVGKTAGALVLPPDPDGSFTVFVTAGPSSGDALRLLDDARRRGFRSLRARSDAWWGRWIGRARLPATDDARTRAVAKRALMLIRTAQDRRTGAIVANTTVQTPYRQDWVRDGAFFNYALLLAGYPEMAIAHSDFYRRVYRPGGTWDSFYYTDGAEAGAVFPYEIDTQGLAIWALWSPYELGAAGRDYLERVWPAIEDTANALLLCRDPRNGLQCYAPEDDAVRPTQGAQGAAAVYLGLRNAVAAARAVGVEPNPRWQERADELRAAVLEHLCDREGCQGGRGGIYLVWPSELLLGQDTSRLLQRHLEPYVQRLDRWSSFRGPPTGGHFQYPMEPVLALATAWEADGKEAALDRWVGWLTHDVAADGVLHYGERIFRTGDRTYLHGVGFPHIWSGAEAYLAAAFSYGLEGCRGSTDAVGVAPCRTGRNR